MKERETLFFLPSFYFWHSANGPQLSNVAGSLVWMVQAVFIAAAVTFCDQASWQSRIAAKPAQGVIGFIVATFLWFAVPSTIGTSIGVTYLSFSAHNANVTLSNADIDAGQCCVLAVFCPSIYSSFLFPSLFVCVYVFVCFMS